MIYMYYINKIPTPRGYKILKKEIPVSYILGADRIYNHDGELKAEYTRNILQNQEINLKIIYAIRYNNGDTREFVAFKKINSDNRTYSLSDAPIIEGTKRYVTEIGITVLEE